MLRGNKHRANADIGCFSTTYYAGAFPISSVFELPLGFRSSEVASRAFMKFVSEQKPADLEKVKVLTVFATPPAQS